VTTTCTVEDCDAKTDGFVCSRHLNQVRTWLAGTEQTPSLTELLRELDVTITRQDRGTGTALYAMRAGRMQQPGVHYDEGDTALPSTSWPFSWDAANVRWNVVNTLSTWARHIMEARHVTIPIGPVCHQPPNWVRPCAHLTCEMIRARRNPAGILLALLDSIRQDEAASELHDELRACHRDLLQAVDRQDPDLFAGRCDATLLTTHLVDDGSDDGVLVSELAECGTDLMGRTGDDEVKCPTCGAVYDLIAQDRKLKAALPEALATPQVIADGLSTADEQINASTVRTWIERDRKVCERVKVGPVCASCKHASCVALRSNMLAFEVRYQGRPMIPRRGVNDAGESVYRTGDVQARIAWAAVQKARRVSA
jgi:hypothetical protein